MNLSKLIAYMQDSNRLKQMQISRELDSYIGNQQQRNLRLDLKKVIAAYLSGGSPSDIKKGIKLVWDSPNEQLSLTFNCLLPAEQQKEIVLPMFSSHEESMVEKLFALRRGHEAEGYQPYVLRNYSMLSHTLKKLHNRYGMKDLFGIEVTAYTLRSLRFYGLLFDSGVPAWVVWSGWLGSWDRYLRGQRSALFGQSRDVLLHLPTAYKQPAD
jgi:hypothetical protein